MSLSERIQMVLSECKVKQTEFAESLGISANYVNLIANGKKNNISDTLAKLIEETYGYSSEWILSGNGEKRITDDLTASKIETIKKIKKMSGKEVEAVLAFVNSLEDVQSILNAKEKE